MEFMVQPSPMSDHPAPDDFASRVLRGGGEMGELMRRFDWTETPLGAVPTWPATLRTIVGILLSTRHPMFLWWGPELIQFYNDGYRQSLGSDRHPSALGQRGRECWAEIWSIIGGEVESIMAGGDATWHEDHLVPITRGDRVQDVYWSYSYSPVHDDEGGVGGILVTVQETTQRVLAERRKQLLRELGESLIGSQSPHEVAVSATLALEAAPDLALAAIYLREEPAGEFELASLVGVSAGAIPSTLATSQAWPLNEWPASVREGVLLPLVGEGTTEPGGILVAGANPRLALDEAYRTFFADLGKTLSSALEKVRARRLEQQTEQQLRNAERLQAVGALAGGVAHEVNNQMTVVLGFGEFVLSALGPDHPQAADVKHVLTAGTRAARVSQQLLTFTRQQITRPQVIELASSVRTLAPVLRQLLGSDKTLILHPGDRDSFINIDPGQIEQVLINLVANARDATPTGGRVTITVEQVNLDESIPGLRDAAVVPGPYVLLTVADTGCGMDQLTIARIFDPFFTTKPVGEGSGLGLSMVYGIVKRHDGYVWAESSPGRGTRMRLCWPGVSPGAGTDLRIGTELRIVERVSPDERAPTIWVVEDEAAVRELVARTLALEGLRVVTAEDGADAMRLLREEPVPPTAVIIDLVMPHLNGRQVSEAVAALHGSVPVLFMSGHASDEVMRRGLLPENAAFLQKPFTRDDLVQALNSVLVGSPVVS
jgi:signal transduction histidine kinase/CheY-like chemotaxis protein